MIDLTMPDSNNSQMVQSVCSNAYDERKDVVLRVCRRWKEGSSIKLAADTFEKTLSWVWNYKLGQVEHYRRREEVGETPWLTTTTEKRTKSFSSHISIPFHRVAAVPLWA